jgi:hypothetical protein
MNPIEFFRPNIFLAYFLPWLTLSFDMWFFCVLGFLGNKDVTTTGEFR